MTAMTCSRPNLVTLQVYQDVEYLAKCRSFVWHGSVACHSMGSNLYAWGSGHTYQMAGMHDPAPEPTWDGGALAHLLRVMDMRLSVTGGTQCIARSAPLPFSTRQDPAATGHG